MAYVLSFHSDVDNKDHWNYCNTMQSVVEDWNIGKNIYKATDFKLFEVLLCGELFPIPCIYPFIFKCKLCTRDCTEHIPAVISQSFLNWQFGELIQRAFPHLSPTEREYIMGMCSSCQAYIFGEKTDE